ncbi:MAG TPA: hypothetical protein VEM41_04540 [Actinomycetota bacterium]|nr:hypothetical protein [Actinomycetota bacterium]
MLVAVLEARADIEPAPDGLRSLVAGAVSAARSVAGSAGVVQQLVGDRVRAVFGVPNPGEDDVRQALDVATEIVRTVRALGSGAEAIGAVLSVRVGVEAGDVVVPDAAAAEPVVAGDPATIADALARVAPEDVILVGPGTSPAVGGELSLGRTEVVVDLADGRQIRAHRALLPGDADDEFQLRTVAVPEPTPEESGPVAEEASPQPAAAPASADAAALEAAGDERADEGRWAEAMVAYLKALAARRGDPARGGDRARLCVKSLRLATREESIPPAEPAALEALVAEGLSENPDDVTRAWLLALRGACAHLWTGTEGDPLPVEERIAAAEEAQLIGQSAGAIDLVAFAGGALDALYWVAGDYTRALENARRQLSLVDGLTSPGDQADLLVRAAFTILYTEGGYGEVAELAKRAQALAKTLDPHTTMHATFLMMSAAHYRGRWNDLRPALEEHLEAFAIDPSVSCPSARGGPALGALTFAQMGDLESARRFAALVGYDPASPETGDGILARYAVACGEVEVGRRMAEAVLSVADDPDATYAFLESVLASQDWAAAREFIPSARSIADGMAVLGPACDRAEGLVEAVGGKRWTAIELLKGSLGAFERLSVPFEAARTRETLAGITGPEEARDYLEHAIAAYDRLGAVPSLERARGALARIERAGAAAAGAGQSGEDEGLQHTGS